MTSEELKAFDDLKDEDIDFSDIPETDEEFWKDAEVIHPGAEKVILSLESEVLQWYQSKGKRQYKNLMRKALKSYMQAAGE